MKTLFFDTYAFYELIGGNKSYGKYMEKIVIITTKLNLMELHYGLLLKYGRQTADLYYDEFKGFVVEINDEIIKQANELKAKLKKRKLSYVDCIGYTVAKLRNVKFLTGDNQFADLENVEYVK